jgi:hypothetical protein
MLEVDSEYTTHIARCEQNGRLVTMKPPAILQDRLSNNDWTVIATYHHILAPIKVATMSQGQAGSRFGAIWRVLPAYETLLAHFEVLRQQYPVNAALQVHHKATRPKRLQRDSQSQLTFLDNKATASQITAMLPPDQYLVSEYHLSTNVNLGWQKLDQYYTRLDDTLVYVAAVVLHPRMEWR